MLASLVTSNTVDELVRAIGRFLDGAHVTTAREAWGDRHDASTLDDLSPFLTTAKDFSNPFLI